MSGVSKNCVTTKVLELVSEITGVQESHIGLNDRLMEDLNVDSLDFVRLTQLVEDTFGIMFEDEAVADAKTVSDFVTLSSTALSALPEKT